MKTWKCGSHQLLLGEKTYVMGILNVTPDSFSGDGKLGKDPVERAQWLIECGADILDVGGESTRPGSDKVPADVELERVIPVIQAVAKRFETPISIDTTKAEVALEAIKAGVCIVNDVSGATFDDAMLSTIAPTGCGVVLMHLRGTPQSMGWSERIDTGATKPDVIHEVIDFWKNRIAAAREVGIEDERICLDAGFGFGKSMDENLELIRHGRELSALGYPTLSGTSRKSTIGKLLGGLPVEERLMGTAATTALAIANGADIVRVHDVKEIAQVVQVADAVVR